MDKVTDSWLLCHEFQPNAAEDPACRGNQSTLNIFRLKRPPVGVEVRGGGARAGVVLVTWPWLKMTRSVTKSPSVAE
ncbi:hypothetical protein TNCV_4699621, partial [Trichonephila clavipes]